MNRTSVWRTSGQNQGFALLVVVAAIAVVTVAVVGASRRCLMTALECADAIDDLQGRWVQVSLERASLIAASTLYGRQGPPLIEIRNSAMKQPRSTLTSNTEQRWKFPPPTIHTVVMLNGKKHQIYLADESAKINLNTIVRLKSPETAQRVAMTLSAGKINQIRMPQASRIADGASEAPFVNAWGEILMIGPRSESRIPLDEIPSATQSLTLITSGRLNVIHADDKVLFEMSRLILSDSKSRDWIEEFRESFPTRSLNAIFASQGMDPDDQRQLLQLLTDRTELVSVWIQGPTAADDMSFCTAALTKSRTWNVRTLRYPR